MPKYHTYACLNPAKNFFTPIEVKPATRRGMRTSRADPGDLYFYLITTPNLASCNCHTKIQYPRLATRHNRPFIYS